MSSGTQLVSHTEDIVLFVILRHVISHRSVLVLEERGPTEYLYAVKSMIRGGGGCGLSLTGIRFLLR